MINMINKPDISFLKNLKSIAIITLVPIFFTLMFGAVFSKTYVEDIPIAVLDLDQTTISRDIIEALEDSEGLQIAYYVSSLPEMEELLLQRKIYGGLVLPDGFGLELRRAQSPNALFLIDYSNILIGNNMQAYAGAVFNTLNAGLSIGILEAGQIVPYVAEQSVTTLTFTERILYDPRLSYFLYMYAIILAVVVQQTYLTVVAPLFVEEKLRLRNLQKSPDSAGGFEQGKKIELGKMGKNVLIFALSSFAGAFSSLALAHYIFGYPTEGSLLAAISLQALFLLNLTAMALVFAVFFEDATHCAQFILFLSIPAVLLCGYTWPEFMMEPWLAALLRKIWPLTYFINPLKDVHIKGAGFGEIYTYLRGGLLFAAVWVPLALIAFKKACKNNS